MTKLALDPASDRAQGRVLLSEGSIRRAFDSLELRTADGDAVTFEDVIAWAEVGIRSVYEVSADPPHGEPGTRFRGRMVGSLASAMILAVELDRGTTPTDPDALRLEAQRLILRAVELEAAAGGKRRRRG